jgi:iron complex transport system ATP-binding protein
MTTPALSFHDVSFGYQTAEPVVLKGVSLNVPEGSVTAVLGPNGAGKTTLLHLALGWLRPQGGEVFLGGKPVHDYSQRERGRLMSLVPQKEHIPFEYSIIEYVLLGRAPYLTTLEMPGRGDYGIAMGSIESVGLDGMQERPISDLSSGERQLVLVARALTQQPRVMLLDEPTSHLDMRNKKRLIEIIGSQKALGRTVLFTTHELDVAARLADRVVLMRSGEVLRAGPLDEVLVNESVKEAYGLDVKVVDIAGKKIVLWL